MKKHWFNDVKCMLPVAAMGVIIIGILVKDFKQKADRECQINRDVNKFAASHPNWADSIAVFDAKNAQNIDAWHMAAQNAKGSTQADSLYALLGRHYSTRADMVARRDVTEKRIAHFRDSISKVR